jgi:hypothetical protein
LPNSEHFQDRNPWPGEEEPESGGVTVTLTGKKNWSLLDACTGLEHANATRINVIRAPLAIATTVRQLHSSG